MLIGITGYAQHGKDTAGAHLVNKWGFQRFAFADQLKSMALTLDPYIEFEHYSPPLRLSRTVEYMGWEDAKKLPEVRRFLQVLGTEAVRDHLGDDSWIRALDLARTLSPAKHHVITDVRFPNEAEYVRRHSGNLVRIVRWEEDGEPFDNGISRGHPSEQNVPGIQTQFTINTVSGNIAQLKTDLDAIVFFLLSEDRTHE